MTLGLHYLPVELLYLIQLLALSEHLPLTSHHLKNVFDSSPNSFRAQYITRRIITDPVDWPPNLYSKVLRYRLCTPPVLEIVCTRCASATNLQKTTELPKHLFRRLDARKRAYTDSDEPLPFLRLIEANPAIPPLNVNAHSGFALTMAVHASFIPLICYLLEMGASPAAKDAIAVIVAIRKKDVKLVRMLIEPAQKSSSKRRRIPDRMRCSEYPELLKVAIKVDARDIVNYLREKGCVPDLGMIKWLSF
ncbi:hypothetical protein BDZ89DRAFT_1091588 [Hymenopellis radicata]|nr:hypothetical protein BDZ89DRAFT_1091588 [Hymenopellis radicata]